MVWENFVAANFKTSSFFLHHISVRQLSALMDIYGFHYSLQTDVATASFRVLSHSVFSNLSVIRLYVRQYY
jgi:hypothetical protein